MTIADRIKHIRTQKKITQQQLADMCGYANKGNISRIEHSGDDVTVKQVKRIAEKLNVSVAYLMGYEIETFSDLSANQYKRLMAYAEKIRGDQNDNH